MSAARRDKMDSIAWLKGFGAGYGDRVVLDGVNLEVPVQGLFALMGPTGVGKSTLLRVLCGVAQQNANFKSWGEMRYRGLLAGEAGWPSLVAQDARLLVSTLRENLACSLPNRAELTLAGQMDLIQSQLDRLKCEYLAEHMEQQVVGLPLADQRIVAIVRQTLAQPDLLCADEPTSGLEEVDAKRVMTVLRHWSRDRAVLVALHHQRAAREYADQVLLLASGRIQERAQARDFFSEPRSSAGREFIERGTCTSVRPNTPPEDLAPEIVSPKLSSNARRAMSAWSGPHGFVWLIKGRVAGTPMPGVLNDEEVDLDALRRVGVTRLLTLLEHPLECTEAMAERGIRAYHFEVPDMHAPTLEQAKRLCRRIDGWQALGHVVAVHCRAGHGRTGTALAAWKIWHGSTAAEAVEHIRKLERQWIQSQRQIEFLEQFEAHLRHREPAAGSAR